MELDANPRIITEDHSPSVELGSPLFLNNGTLSVFNLIWNQVTSF